MSGHQRSPTVRRNRRSRALQLRQLGYRRREIRIVVPKVMEHRGVRSRVAGQGLVDGRCSRPGACRMPPAGAGAPPASDSRSWCRPRGCRARHWWPPRGWSPSQRQAAAHTAPAEPRSAGPGPGRAKSPLKQCIEHLFEAESGMLLTQSGSIAGHIGARAGASSGLDRASAVLLAASMLSVRRFCASPRPACGRPPAVAVFGRRTPGRMRLS
jgi:hypothetical protein